MSSFYKSFQIFNSYLISSSQCARRKSNTDRGRNAVVDYFRDESTRARRVPRQMYLKTLVAPLLFASLTIRQYNLEREFTAGRYCRFQLSTNAAAAAAARNVGAANQGGCSAATVQRCLVHLRRKLLFHAAVQSYALNSPGAAAPNGSNLPP